MYSCECPACLSWTIFSFVSSLHSLAGTISSGLLGFLPPLTLRGATSSPDNVTGLPPSHCRTIGTTPVVKLGAASTAQPYEFQPFTPKTTSVPLENSELRLHHSPPSSAPSFTTGVVPIVLQWLGGTGGFRGERLELVRLRRASRRGRVRGADIVW
jgi:hypothetical protein